MNRKPTIEEATLSLPEGYMLVHRGEVREGDMYFREGDEHLGQVMRHPEWVRLEGDVEGAMRAGVFYCRKMGGGNGCKEEEEEAPQLTEAGWKEAVAQGATKEGLREWVGSWLARIGEREPKPQPTVWEHTFVFRRKVRSLDMDAGDVSGNMLRADLLGWIKTTSGTQILAQCDLVDSELVERKTK